MGLFFNFFHTPHPRGVSARDLMAIKLSVEAGELGICKTNPNRDPIANVINSQRRDIGRA